MEIQWDPAEWDGADKMKDGPSQLKVSSLVPQECVGGSWRSLDGIQVEGDLKEIIVRGRLRKAHFF